MEEDNISQRGDNEVLFCEQQYTHGSCYVSLFKFKSFDQLCMGIAVCLVSVRWFPLMLDHVSYILLKL